MEKPAARPGVLCVSLSALAVYLGVPCLAAVPFVVVYLLTGSWGQAVGYTLLGVFLLVVGGVVLLLVLMVCVLALLWSWEHVVMRLAFRCQRCLRGPAGR